MFNLKVDVYANFRPIHDSLGWWWWFFSSFSWFLKLLCKTPPFKGKRFWSLKKYSQNISPHFLDAAGGQISHLWLYFHFLLLLYLLQAQLAPFFIYLEYLHTKTRLKLPSEIFGCGEKGRQNSEILNDLAPIALIP